MAFAGSLAKADILLQNCLQRQEVRRSIVRDAQQTMVRSMRKHCEALASQDVPGARHGVVHLCDALAADDVAGLALALTVRPSGRWHAHLNYSCVNRRCIGIRPGVVRSAVRLHKGPSERPGEIHVWEIHMLESEHRSCGRPCGCGHRPSSGGIEMLFVAWDWWPASGACVETYAAAAQTD